MDTRFGLVVHSDPSPARNIALDEVLLNKAIATGFPYVRLWENLIPVIYLGIGKRWRDEVFEESCLKDQVPILRRFSGGGTVLHLPGTLNYTLALPIALFPECATIAGSYQFALHWLNQALRPCDLPFLEMAGHSDFCLNGRKVSGNAQARRKQMVLHHGTLMTLPHVDAIERYLREPKVQPDYRDHKKHRQFVSDLQSEGFSLDLKGLEQLVSQHLLVREQIKWNEGDLQEADELVESKYSQDTWNLKL